METPRQKLAIAQREYFKSLPGKFDDEMTLFTMTEGELHLLKCFTLAHGKESNTRPELYMPLIDRINEYFTIQ